ncbi:hypothetical protein BCR35DRAFT_305047 [Leucosporidium creatinivorum]|uniref:F-box domain-containing protein n=1 Tax=Leucosporidium creatinivorum TaxID=106004 RepID=A0A1Y2F3J0_9BASI|nr:hypothetical protein BCR35DRAFT_305047 [Leucosporidium creatinivorum]
MFPGVEATGPSSKLDFATLSALCLTSKELLPLARSKLYRRVVASFGSGMEGSVEELHPYLWLNDAGLTLLNYPHLASRVVELEVKLEEVESSTKANTLAKAVIDLLKCCYNLKVLDLDGDRFPFTMDHLPGALTGLDLFANLTELSTVQTGPNALLLLSECINLQRLNLRPGVAIFGDDDTLDQPPVASFPFRLGHFTVPSDLSLPIFRAITFNSTDSLHILHLHSEDFLRLREPIAELASLDELCITWQQRNGQYSPSYTKDLSSALNALTSLRTLTIQALRQAPAPSSLLSRLPPTITTLYLSRVHIKDIIPFLASDTGRRLSKLAVGGFYRFSSELEEEEERRLLEEAAGQAGVRLVDYWWNRFDHL